MTTSPSDRHQESSTGARWLDLVGICGLMGVVLMRWHSDLLAPEPLIDEQIYLQAFQAVASGASPFSVRGFYYPAFFALAGGWVLETLGQLWAVALLRVATAIGLVATVWLSLRWWPTRWWRRFVVAAVFVTVAPAIQLALDFGNITFAVVGMIVTGLSVWHRHPLAAGLLLGGSVGVKPIAPAAVLTLLSHRPRRGGHQHLVAGLVGGLCMMGLLLPVSKVVEMSNQTIEGLTYKRSISLYRMLAEVGLQVSPLTVAVVIAGLAVLISWRLKMTQSDLMCFATTASLLTVPIIWSHTFLLVLPVQVIALVRAADRWRDARNNSESESYGEFRRYEPFLVFLGMAAIQLSGGAGAVDDQPVVFRVLALAVPYLAAPALTTYILATGRSQSGNP